MKENVEKVFDRIVESLTNKVPASFIRLGDGEARILDYDEKKYDLPLDNSLKMWFGRTNFDHGWKLRIKKLLIESCQNADVLGLPPDANKAKNIGFSCIEDYYLEHHNLRGENAILANASFHRNLQEHDLYKKIFSRRNGEIKIITGRIITFYKPENTLKVPTEAPGIDDENKFQGDHPALFTHTRAKIFRWIYPGDLVLVGAGIFGKIYCNDIKKQGGVAIDVGSMMDAWAGVKTRGFMNEMGNYTLAKSWGNKI